MTSRYPIAFFLVSLLASGCTSTQQPPDETLRFAAIYSTVDGRQLQVTVSGPELIMDRDGERRLAYRMDILADAGVLVLQDGTPGPEVRATFHMDSDFLVVRAEFVCQSRLSDGQCDPQTLVLWSVQGLPPPFGMYWPRLQGMASLPFMGATLPWSAAFARDARELVATQTSSPVGVLLDGSGPFRYTDRDFPTEIHGTVSFKRQYRIDATLRDVKEGPELRGADDWPKVELAPIAWANAPLIVEGENDPVLTRPFTLMQALDKLLARNEEAATRVAGGGCVVGVKVVPLSARTGGGPGDPGGVQTSLLGVDYAQMTFEIAGRTGPGLKFILTYKSANSVQPEEWTVEQTAETNDESCDRKRSIAPVTSMSEFLAKVQSLPLQGDFQVNSYGATWAPRPSWRERAGDVTYFAAPYDRATLGEGLTLTNQVYYLPGPGWWDQVYLPNAAVQALDGR